MVNRVKDGETEVTVRVGGHARIVAGAGESVFDSGMTNASIPAFKHL